ncbi:EcsC family protein [Enterococcus bulliens]
MESHVESNKGLQILDYLYDKTMNGIPAVSKPVEELANDYIKKYGRTDKAINKLLNNQLSKNTINGFVTSFGGFATMAVTLPANVTSVLYVQMRMIAAIAIIRGYDTKDDEIQTFVYSCLVGNVMADAFKNVGVEVGNQIALNAVKKIPGSTLTKINQKLDIDLLQNLEQKGLLI